MNETQIAAYTLRGLIEDMEVTARIEATATISALEDIVANATNPDAVKVAIIYMGAKLSAEN